MEIALGIGTEEGGVGQGEVGWVGSDSNDAHLVHKSLMLNCDLWFLPERLALVFKIIQTGTVWLPSGLPPPSTAGPHPPQPHQTGDQPRVKGICFGELTLESGGRVM